MARRTLTIDSPLPTIPPRWNTRSTPSSARRRRRGRAGRRRPARPRVEVGGLAVGVCERVEVVEHPHALAAREQGVDEVGPMKPAPPVTRARLTRPCPAAARSRAPARRDAERPRQQLRAAPRPPRRRRTGRGMSQIRSVSALVKPSRPRHDDDRERDRRRVGPAGDAQRVPGDRQAQAPRNATGEPKSQYAYGRPAGDALAVDATRPTGARQAGRSRW